MARADLCRGRCDVDDPPPLRPNHGRQKKLAAIISAREIRLQSFVPKCVRHVRKVYSASDPSVVDQNLHVAPAGFNFFAETLYLIPLRDVTRQGENLRVVLRHLFSCRIEPVAIASRNYDTGFFPREGFRERLAESAASAGDQYNFVLQIAHRKKNILSRTQKRNRMAEALAYGRTFR